MNESHVQIGSVSHGTLRNEDLIPVFFDLLCDIDSKRAIKDFSTDVDMFAENADEDGNYSDEDQEEISYVVEEMMDALDEYAPPYMYFGAHQGDGSDFGFWLDHDSIETAVQDRELLSFDDDYPDDWFKGEWLHVNDHGNMTLYYAVGNGEHKEIWSVV